MRKDPCCPGVIAAILHPLMARSASNLMRLLAVACLAALCACGSAQKKQTVAEKANLLDQTITEKQLDQLSNAFADRYFTLMLAASERIMRDNPDLQQRRIMNGLRLLGVSSMYDIATSPDTVTQLVDQLVVVTLQNYFWVDSGRSQVIWGDRAQYLVQNLRRAREDIWSIGARVFTREQLDELDLLISNWWSTNGGTEFVAYVRFSDVAASRGSELIEEVRSGGGLLEPLDRATEQVLLLGQARAAVRGLEHTGDHLRLPGHAGVAAATEEHQRRQRHHGRVARAAGFQGRDGQGTAGAVQGFDRGHGRAARQGGATHHEHAGDPA
jgi:hypothetical protein